MAFMGIFFVYLAIILIILGVSTTIAIILYIIAAVIAHKAKKQASMQNGSGYRKPASVIVLRVIGTVFMIPLAAVALLIGYGVVSTMINQHDNLGSAVSYYDFEETERLLKKGIDPNCGLESKEHVTNGQQSILSAVIEDDSENFWRGEHSEEDKIKMVKLLIEYGADVNAVTYAHEKDDSCHTYTEESDIYHSSDECGYTPLLYAVRNGDFEVVKVLVENGADVNAQDYCGYSAIATIADNLNDEQGEEMLVYLINAGADPTVPTNFRQDAVFLASRRNRDGDNDSIWAILLGNMR